MGKTSVLRCVAGLERARSARVVVDGEVCQQIGHAHDMVKIGAGMTFWLARRQPEEIFHAEGNAHKHVILQLGDGYKFIDIDRGFGQQIFFEHKAATGDTHDSVLVCT